MYVGYVYLFLSSFALEALWRFSFLLSPFSMPERIASCMPKVNNVVISRVIHFPKLKLQEGIHNWYRGSVRAKISLSAVQLLEPCRLVLFLRCLSTCHYVDMERVDPTSALTRRGRRPTFALSTSRPRAHARDMRMLLYHNQITFHVIAMQTEDVPQTV